MSVDLKSIIEDRWNGYQEFSSVDDPLTVTADTYEFKLTLNGSAFNSGNDINVIVTENMSFSDLATAIETAINNIVASSVSVDVVGGKIRIRSLDTTTSSAISILAPTDGNNLITLLTSVESAIANIEIGIVEYVEYQDIDTVFYGIGLYQKQSQFTPDDFSPYGTDMFETYVMGTKDEIENQVKKLVDILDSFEGNSKYSRIYIDTQGIAITDNPNWKVATLNIITSKTQNDGHRLFTKPYISRY